MDRDKLAKENLKLRIKAFLDSNIQRFNAKVVIKFKKFANLICQINSLMIRKIIFQSNPKEIIQKIHLMVLKWIISMMIST